MAQLTDDCFAFSGPLLPVADMERLIAERVTPVTETEDVTLAAARGRVLASDIAAPLDLPPFDNSSVDGYAVRHGDLDAKAETRLKIAGRLFAGSAAAAPIQAGQAIRIFTGAPMPAGADTVFMQEDTREDDDSVIVPSGLKRGANRRLAGEDVRKGSIVLPAGRRLAAQDVALAAAVGLTSLKVRRRVRVALFSTGDEIVEPGTPRPDAALYDANRYLLSGMLERLGAQTTDLGILKDNPDVLAKAIAAAAKNHDLVLTSGGVSTGEADHVRATVEKVGKLWFWRVAIKPGRPVAMGVVPGSGNGAAFVGLPGNPVAAFVTFARVVRPLLLRLGGAQAEPLTALPVKLAFDYKKKSGRREYVRVALRKAADGSIEAIRHPQEGAGVITSLTETDGLAELNEDSTAIAKGATVGFLSYATLMG
jgi:molybdopterin molybdotransferase